MERVYCSPHSCGATPASNVGMPQPRVWTRGAWHGGSQSVHSVPTELWEVPIIIGRSENCCMAALSEGPSASLHKLSLATADMARA